MATIKDVAKRAGVSIATVSRVMNNDERVGESYRAAVEAAIAELRFQPNMAARSLKKRPYRTIGVIMPDFSTPFYEQIIKRIEADFRAAGDLVLFVNTYDDPEIERRGIDFMLERQADILLVSSTGKNEDRLERARQAGVGILFVDRRPLAGDFPAVYMDKKSGMRQSLAYLEAQGHRRIAVVTGPQSLASNRDRADGTAAYLREQGRAVEDIPFYYGSFSKQYGYEAAAQLMTDPTPPTAIIAGSAVITAGILRYCREHGIAVPRQLSLISFGDLGSGELIEPRLTYVTDEHERIGELLSERIAAHFAGKTDHTVSKVEPRLKRHDSVCQWKGETL